MDPKDKVVQRSNIKLSIGLNEEKMPIRIDWEADDNPAGQQQAKAMLLSLFEPETKDTLRIDLWTKDMQVMEMDRFMFHTLRGLADTYYRASQNAALANEMQRFVNYFGEKTGIIPPDNNPH
ncbi:MAG: gliding motility protein GldC [Bacteroidetes bacterium]|nr:MAG: gliding motility protein GldC [Bacteroidota bacterium]